jgi:hypothetical protein
MVIEFRVPVIFTASYALFGVQTTPALLIQIIVSKPYTFINLWALSLILFPGNGLLAMIIAGPSHACSPVLFCMPVCWQLNH